MNTLILACMLALGAVLMVGNRRARKNGLTLRSAAHSLVAIGASMFALGDCKVADAGFIVVQPVFQVEDKGLFVPVIPLTISYISALHFTLQDPPALPILDGVLVNHETAFLPVGPPFHIFDIYPALQVSRVEPIRLIDLFILVSANTGTGLGPLPTGAMIQQASLTGNATGTVYNGSITQINNLTNLPTSSTNNVLIDWNITNVTQTTGNFYLIEVTIPATEFIPEPTSFSLTGIGLLGLLGYRLRQTKGRLFYRRSMELA